ncbi:MAG: ABC transporter permease [Pseudomonadota bacterium]
MPIAVTVIRPPQGRFHLGLRAAWQRRGLLRELLARDIRLKYRIGIFGVLWALLQPLALLAAFSLMLGHTQSAKTLGMPYALYVFPGLILWMLFANGTSNISLSLVSSTHLVGKIYFPRLLLPLATLGPYLIDFLIALLLLLGWLLWQGRAISWQLLWALPAFVGMLAATLTSGLLLAVWLLRYRDLRPLVGFVLQVGMLVTPVAYSAAMLPSGMRHWLWLNPLSAPVNSFRAAFSGGDVQALALGLSLLFWLVALAAALAYFQHHDRQFADYA